MCLSYNLNAKECLISGKWKSNQKATLSNMAKVELPDKTRKALENNFFGRLIVINTCEKTTSYFEEEGKSKAEVTKFISIKEKDKIVTLKYFIQPFDNEVTEIIEVNDNCYSTSNDLVKLGFSEVFCRIK